jgi:cystathionine beta-lyase/cystathionine gamma-synthase
MDRATRCIHSGQKPEEVTGAVMPPIFMTSTFAQEAPGVMKGYDYTRAGNPNFDATERLLADLEGAKHATIFSSGLGGITALISTLKQGDEVLCCHGLYGGTFRLFSQVFQGFGVSFRMLHPEEVAGAITAKTRMLFFETPTNPLLGITDIAELCKIASAKGIRTVVDNTFATPIFQNPIELGADVVVHSTTKYIGGHSDVIGGVVMTNDAALKEQLDFNRMAIGLNPSPFDAWLTLRGVKTLAVRMEAHARNAESVAKYFDKHPLVRRVYFPGLESHPGHGVAARQMRGYSGMVAVEFDLDLEQAKTLVSQFKVFTLAESLGGVESLVCHPASMTHASIPKEVRESYGLSDGLMRFSCGIEATEDILGDIEAGLDQLLTAHSS